MGNWRILVCRPVCRFVCGLVGGLGWTVLLAAGVAGARAQELAQAAQQGAPPAQQGTPAQQETGPQKPKSTVIFSRSAGDAAPAGDAAAEKQAAQNAPAVKIPDAEREALTFTAYDLDVRLMPRQESLAVRAQLHVRNDGDAPLKRVALQLSSTLRWEEIRIGGKRAEYSQQTLASDADHTGSLKEAVVTLAEPLAPRAELELDVVYSGQVAVSGKRLEQIGTPADVAAHADWDQVDLDFVGLRGFGNVVWYPVSSAPVALGDGAKLFTEIGAQKLRQSAARMHVQVTEEYFAEAPNVAVIDGQVVPLKVVSTPTGAFPGIAKCELGAGPLGFESPSLFVAVRQEHKPEGKATVLDIFSRIENAGNVGAYETAATTASALFADWLGAEPRTPLTLVDLAQTDDTPFETGSVLFEGLSGGDAGELASEMSHALSHAYFRSPRMWLNEGVANFMGSLWVEKTLGREGALQKLEALRGPLTLAEPEGGNGQPLNEASDPVYFRTKATYVLWMLRGIAGDKALAAALRAYDPAKDSTGAEGQDYFEKLLEQASGKDLKWFFDDWVYRDAGLPDLSVAGVFPSKTSVPGQYLVAVDVANDGYAVADVPVTMRSQGTTVTERMRIPPRSREVHRMLIQGSPLEVLVNDGTVPEVQSSVHSKTMGDAAGNPSQ